MHSERSVAAFFRQGPIATISRRIAQFGSSTSVSPRALSGAPRLTLYRVHCCGWSKLLVLHACHESFRRYVMSYVDVTIATRSAPRHRRRI